MTADHSGPGSTVPSENHVVAARQETNPYRHDHNPLNEDFHGGMCSACEWEVDELHCPSVDVCGWCGDSECDGIGCIASLNPDDPADHAAIEQLHDWLRRGQLLAQLERRLAIAENRS